MPEKLIGPADLFNEKTFLKVRRSSQHVGKHHAEEFQALLTRVEALVINSTLCYETQIFLGAVIISAAIDKLGDDTSNILRCIDEGEHIF